LSFQTHLIGFVRSGPFTVVQIPTSVGRGGFRSLRGCGGLKAKK